MGLQGEIICLVGSLGADKTRIGQSIVCVLGGGSSGSRWWVDGRGGDQGS